MPSREIGDQSWSGDDEALDAMEALHRRQAEKAASIPSEKLEAALGTVTRMLNRSWDTDGGTQLRRFVWSLWNGHHPVNLYDLTRSIDDDVAEASILIFTAAMRGVLKEDDLRSVLLKSGEMARWDAAEKETAQQVPVDYPPIPRLLRDHVARIERAPKSDQGKGSISL